MKKQDRVILHREMLYRDVWKTPIRQLAKKYGISDVGLAKICKRMNIPLPQRGYWAKKDYGHKVEQLPLPPLKGKYPSEVTLNKSEEELLQLARNRFSASKTAHRERKRIHRLQNEMKEWETSWRVRAYIAAMHAAGNTVKPGMAEYLAWAETYADHLDPGKDFCNDALPETGFRDSYNDFSQIEK